MGRVHRSPRRQRATAMLVGTVVAGATLGLLDASASADARDAGTADAAAADGGATADAKPGISKTPPDPPALSEREQWVFVLRWTKNEPYLVTIHKTDMGAPHPTPRVMGRFALELFEGPTLIERVRFNFPMLGGTETPDAGWKTPPRFEPGLTTRIGVLFPATKRGTRLELWDRATDRRWPLPWPPKAGVFADPPPAPEAAIRDAGPG